MVNSSEKVANLLRRNYITERLETKQSFGTMPKYRSAVLTGNSYFESSILVITNSYKRSILLYC